MVHKKAEYSHMVFRSEYYIGRYEDENEKIALEGEGVSLKSDLRTKVAFLLSLITILSFDTFYCPNRQKTIKLDKP